MNRRTWWLLGVPLLGICLGIGFLEYQSTTDRNANPVGKQMEVISLVGTNTPSELSKKTFTNAPTSGLVSIYAGDSSVSQPDIKNVSALIENISAPVLARNLGILPNRKTRIVLYGTSNGYLSAVEHAFGAKDASSIEQQTGGFTVQSTVYVPLYKYRDNAPLGNTLTHELTHATLNEAGVGPSLPTWISEGFAWHDGLAAAKKLNPSETMQMLDMLSQQMNTAEQDGNFIPVSNNPSVLPANPTYNIEYEDYTIVNSLIERFGIKQVRQFLFDIPGKGLNQSFEQHFSMGISEFLSSAHNG